MAKSNAIIARPLSAAIAASSRDVDSADFDTFRKRYMVRANRQDRRLIADLKSSGILSARDFSIRINAKS
jgi:hypothetical protein